MLKNIEVGGMSRSQGRRPLKDEKSKQRDWSAGEPLWKGSLAPLRAEGHQQETNHSFSRNFKLVSELSPSPGSVSAPCAS